jgi:hypothetical protein
MSDSVTAKNNIFDKHPIQPYVNSKTVNVHFKRIYYKQLPNGDVVQRKWFSYCMETNSLHYSNCMAYGVYGNYGEIETKFISGYEVDIKKNKILYCDITINENSIFILILQIQLYVLN